MTRGWKRFGGIERHTEKIAETAGALGDDLALDAYSATRTVSLTTTAEHHVNTLFHILDFTSRRVHQFLVAG